MPEPAAQPLAPFTVVDLSEGIAGPFCTKLLADYGARVIKVEPPGGDISRQWGPFPVDRVDPAASGTFLHLNTNKESIVVDWRRAEGSQVVLDLVASADVLVESSRPGLLATVGLGAPALRELRPPLVICSVTSFGQYGPYSEYDATEIVAFAMAGASASGTPDREPVKLAGNVTQAHAGGNACAATLAALFHAAQTGIGQHVDVSVFECQNGSLDRRRQSNLAYQYSGTLMPRLAAVGVAGPTPGGRFTAADGRMVTTGRIWPEHVGRMGRVIGLELDRDILFDHREESVLEVNAAIAAWIGSRTARQAMREAQAAGWPVVVVNDPLSILTDEHLAARGFWVRPAAPSGQSPSDQSPSPAGTGRDGAPGLPYCGPPWRMEPGGWQLRRTAPALGQDTDSVLRELCKYPDAKIGALRATGVVA